MHQVYFPHFYFISFFHFFHLIFSVSFFAFFSFILFLLSSSLFHFPFPFLLSVGLLSFRFHFFLGPRLDPAWTPQEAYGSTTPTRCYEGRCMSLSIVSISIPHTSYPILTFHTYLVRP
ncbi:hypothetical protein FIBSPDRAFT_208906 [Athelia psychrophila]|uniref:Uncharacterized protein n=1 Tax=Athelia psychrophila TaxID=1759441 RepID=A0A166WPL5_9AGAM|nr:hypothetical protein FIBSPDRAFT_208906 [Fibularhizoctonia sp. CBS 109695]